MIRSLYNSRSGITASQHALDLTAHNIANLNTTAYKRSESLFGDLFYHELHQRRFPAASSQELPVGQGVRVLAKATFLEQGTLVPAERPLELAIEGGGYFKLISGEVEFYTRNGNFQIDGTGKLVNANGDYLDLPLVFEQGISRLTISPGGLVTGVKDDGIPRELGQIKLYHFRNPFGLAELGAGCYRPTEFSGDPQEGLPGDETLGWIRQYYLEQSNSDMGTEMVELLTAQRTLQANVRSLLTADELMAMALQIRL